MNNKRKELIDAIVTGDIKKIRIAKPIPRYIIICSEDDTREYTLDELEQLSKKDCFSDDPKEPYVIKLP